MFKGLQPDFGDIISKEEKEYLKEDGNFLKQINSIFELDFFQFNCFVDSSEYHFENDIVCGRFLKFMAKFLKDRKIDYCRNKSAKKSNLKLLETEYLDNTLEDLFSNPEEKLLEKELSEVKLREMSFAMNDLTKRQKAILRYSYIEGKTDLAIAMQLGVTKNAIEKIKIRAKSKFIKSYNKAMEEFENGK